MRIYCTSFCNHGHRVSDGKPVDHECYILPPKAIQAEMAGDVDEAIEIIGAVRNRRTHRGIRATQEQEST